ncbi:MAG: radical SAM protein [Halodesulfurarchaeum sp.]
MASTSRDEAVDDAEIRERVAALSDRYTDCDLCAHQCGVDRTAGEIGACQVDETVRISSYGPHHGEEPPLRGTHGSGTIFLAHCNLACVFCQNFDISQHGRGARAVTAEELADIALGLQEQGCHNVNFVTPTHHAPTLAEAVLDARDRGLEIPIVWNCGGYESAAVIERLEGIVDVYMPDIKWGDNQAARKFSKAPAYWDAVRPALEEMHRQVGDLTLDADGVATSGLLVRHLVMPEHVQNSKRVVEFVADLSTETYLNIMAQYRPANKVGQHGRYEELNRRITREEYQEVVSHARELGLSRLEVDPPLR